MNNSNLAKKLNHRIELIKVLETRNDKGCVLQNEKTIAKVWAAIKTMSSQEWFNFKRSSTSTYHEITIRLLSELQIGNFALIKNKRMLIKSIEHDEEEMKTTTFIVEEVNEPIKQIK